MVAFMKWPSRFKAEKNLFRAAALWDEGEVNKVLQSTCEEKKILDELVFELNVF